MKNKKIFLLTKNGILNSKTKKLFKFELTDLQKLVKEMQKYYEFSYYSPFQRIIDFIKKSNLTKQKKTKLLLEIKSQTISKTNLNFSKIGNSLILNIGYKQKISIVHPKKFAELGENNKGVQKTRAIIKKLKMTEKQFAEAIDNSLAQKKQ